MPHVCRLREIHSVRCAVESHHLLDMKSIAAVAMAVQFDQEKTTMCNTHLCTYDEPKNKNKIDYCVVPRAVCVCVSTVESMLLMLD